MNRKQDIDRLMTVIQSELIPRIAAARNQEPTESMIASLSADIKSCIEHLRSILDYLAHDVVELVRTPAKHERIYYPFVHPMAGGSQADLDHRFQRKLSELGLDPQLSIAYPKVYGAIEEVQGAEWLSDLISTVNVAKHQSLPQATTKAIEIGAPGDQAAKIRITGRFRMEAGPGRIVVPGHGVIQGPVDITPDDSIPDEIASVVRIREAISANEFEARWLRRLMDWARAVSLHSTRCTPPLKATPRNHGIRVGAIGVKLDPVPDRVQENLYWTLQPSLRPRESREPLIRAFERWFIRESGGSSGTSAEATTIAIRHAWWLSRSRSNQAGSDHEASDAYSIRSIWARRSRVAVPAILIDLRRSGGSYGY